MCTRSFIHLLLLHKKNVIDLILLFDSCVLGIIIGLLGLISCQQLLAAPCGDVLCVYMVVVVTLEVKPCRVLRSACLTPISGATSAPHSTGASIGIQTRHRMGQRC